MKAKWFSLGCLTSIIVIILFFTLSIFMVKQISGSMGDLDLTVKAQPGSMLRVNLSGSISEYNEFENDNFMSALGESSESAYDLIQKIDFAKSDPNIEGIILEVSNAYVGYATAHEIMLSLEDFKAAGKPVYAYMEMVGNKDYFISTVADKIILNPSASAGIMLTGIGSSTVFYKDMFDKLGVEMTVIHAGKYKGAGENYSRNALSEPVRDNLTILFEDVYDLILKEISQNRGMDLSNIKYVYEERNDLFVNQDNAMEYGLVDMLADKSTFYSTMGINADKIVNISKYGFKTKVKLSNQVAVLYAEGAITPVSGSIQSKSISARKMYNAIEDILDDNTIKACVIRVNSPGGSALESEKILTKIKELRERMPVVISMSNVAASGGYYISMASDYLFADKFVITGSIGVVAMFPNASGLADKIGITTDPITKGKFVNSINLLSPPTKATISAMKVGIEGTYLEFKSRVADGRKLDISTVEKYAQGQVWSSEQAIEAGLIDEVGTIKDAVNKAAELANLNGYSEVAYPIKKNLFKEILSRNFDIDITEALFKSKYLEGREIEEGLDFWLQIKSEPIQAVMPCKIDL